MAKLIHRPGVVPEDLRILPGRAGLAAMTQSGMLLSAALAPMSASLGLVVLVVALLSHLILAIIVARLLVYGPTEQRLVTPVWHLTFVGFVVGAVAAAEQGMRTLAIVIFIVTLVLAAFIYAASIRQMLRRDPPAPLRPLLAIHLAPLSLFGTTAHLLGQANLAKGFAILGTVLLAILLIRLRYIIATGYSPLWGAFTFPLSSYAAMMLLLAGDGAGEFFRVMGGLMLVAATLIIPVIAAKILQAWARGGLAAKTNAAIA